MNEIWGLEESKVPGTLLRKYLCSRNFVESIIGFPHSKNFQWWVVGRLEERAVTELEWRITKAAIRMKGREALELGELAHGLVSSNQSMDLLQEILSH